MRHKYSIILATYNAGPFLQRALDSLSSVTYDNFEIIIIDGGSHDDTISIIENNQHKLSFWISEPDRGIYDAWNKGVAKATGHWIMFLGADDTLLPDALSNYNDFLSEYPSDNIQYVSSRMQMIDDHGRNIRIKGWKWEWPKFLDETTVAHPGSLHSRQFFDEYGLFDISYRSSGDFELLIRPKDKLRTLFMDKVTVIMQEGGISDGLIGIREHCKAAIVSGGYSPFLAYKNAAWVYLKFNGKKLLRTAGINAYLKS
jgi:glycosyltransferase involved in cell wall biosynthesis